MKVGWGALTWAVVAYTFLLRLIFCGRVELLPEETYYWNYARHLDFGYLDHPPMVAWLIRTGVAFFGNVESGVRIGAVVCGGVTTYFAFLLTRNLFGRRSALLAVVLVQVLPFFFLSGMLMTPDAPLTAAWMASLYCLERALFGGRPRMWFGAGLCVGLGLLSKYTAVLLPAATLMFLVSDPSSRPWLRRPHPYVAALIALALFAPVIVWNAHHEWASFAFQVSRRLVEAPRFSLHKFLGSLLVLLTPTGLVATVLALIGLRRGRKELRRGRKHDDISPDKGALNSARASRLLWICALLPCGVFAVFSLRHEVKLDWTGAAWAAAIPLLAADRRRLCSAWMVTAAVMTLTFSAGLCYLAMDCPGLHYNSHTELVPEGWRELARQIRAVQWKVRQGDPASALIVGMDRYAIASELAFYSYGTTTGIEEVATSHLFGGVGLMYELWAPPQAQRGRTLLLVAWDRRSLDDAALQPYVDRLDPVHEGVLSREGQTIRRYFYRVAYGYKGLGH
jgi:dolichol-phosphate mannosyltransferase